MIRGCHHDSTSCHWFVLAHGQSSCVGSEAPTDRRFFCDEYQSSYGVSGNLHLLHFFLHCSSMRVGIAINWVTRRAMEVHLRLMYSQATVRSYTKDRAVRR